MNYTDIENITVNKNDEEYEETIINWRKRLGRIQLKCPYCFNFFNVPRDIKFNEQGYATDSLYHFCDEHDEPDSMGWVVQPHLIGWGVQ